MVLAIAAAVATLTATSISLPDPAPVSIDYFAWDAQHHKLWVPAGNTGKVDVIEGDKVVAIKDQPTAPSPRPGRPNVGPSSVGIGNGVAYVGNRADKSVCAFDTEKLSKGRCATVSSKPDGVTWVGATHEVWVTTPDEKTLTIINPDSGALSAIKLDGEPESFAVDDARGRFYTNLEDKDQTVAIDSKTRKVVAAWPTTCGGDGPRGLALDSADQLLFIACASNGAVVYDLAHSKVTGRVATGGGVDLIDYAAKRRLLYVASGKDATLTLAHIDEHGVATVVSTAKTADRVRAVVADPDTGTAYAADSLGGKIWVVSP